MILLTAAASADSGTSMSAILLAVMVAVIALIASVSSAIISARSTSRSVARTLDSDRRNRLRDRQVELYADLLTYIRLRRGARDARSERIKMDAIDYERVIKDFEERDFTDIDGRAQALASPGVLAAFNAAQEAHRNVTRHRHITAMGGLLGDAALMAGEEEYALVTEANRLDTELRDVVREDIHGLPAIS